MKGDATERALLRRDIGMSDSAAHAENVRPGWGDDALLYVAQFARMTDCAWTAEDAREWAHNNGLDEPPDMRAWGSVIATARRRKFMRHVGHVPVNSSNRGYKPLYISTIRNEDQ